MSDAVSRIAAFSPAPSARVLDVTEHQALAGSETGRASRPGAKRGPFRPEVWLNARQRHASRLAAHHFRTFDVATVAALTAGYVAWAAEGGLGSATVTEAAPFAVGALATLGLMRSLGCYRFARGEGVGRHLGVVAAVAALGLGAALLTDLALQGPAAPLGVVALWTAAILAALLGLHLIWSVTVARWRKAGALTPNIVLVGATRHAEDLIREALKRRDLSVLGVFDDRLARSPADVEGVPVLGPSDALVGHKIMPYVDRVVLAIDPKAQVRVRELTARLGALPNEVTVLVDPSGAEETAAALDRLAAAPLADIQGPRNDDRRAYNKRIQDLVVGALALVLLSPVMALIAAAVAVDSPGPIFFRQRRHGFNQEEIVVWKFRSMRHATADATASRQVTHDDDRITRVGRFIRGTSLDELPQLLNVLAGEMSLVGPRPHAIGMKTGHIESARLVSEYAHRHRIKPGMTGWAAVHGSRGPLHTAQDVRRRVRLDLEYVERQSLWLDLWVMAVTVPVLLGDRAAVR